MANILIVDREADVSEFVAMELQQDGHRVDIAQDPGSAVAKACMYHPDLVVSEWMLGGAVDGIDLCQFVETINPDVKSILVTGYASRDLQSLSLRSGIFEFLEKPLPVNALRRSVSNALSVRKPPMELVESSRFSNIGVMSVADTDTIEFINTALYQMIEDVSGSGEEVLLSQLFSVYELALLEEAAQDWVIVTPLESGRKWYVRIREIPGASRRMFVVLDEQHAYWRDSVAVSQLLGIARPALEVEDHFLMIDDNEVFRNVTQSLLKDLNNVCLTADTHEEAIRLFVRDGEIKYVVLDYLMPDGRAEDIVKVMRMLRPDIEIVGTSGDPRNRINFENMGVARFIPKPWTANQLFEAFEISFDNSDPH